MVVQLLQYLELFYFTLSYMFPVLKDRSKNSRKGLSVKQIKTKHAESWSLVNAYKLSHVHVCALSCAVSLFFPQHLNELFTHLFLQYFVKL